MRTRGNEVIVEVPVELMTVTKRRVLERLNLHLLLLMLPPFYNWAAQGTRLLPLSLLGSLQHESLAAVSVS